MQDVHTIRFQPGSREELLPDFAADFPYIATRAAFDRAGRRAVPWHWHRAVELFYMERGALVYETPGRQLVFPAGTGGFINSNVLHATHLPDGTQQTVQLLHIFDPLLIAGAPDSRIAQRYVLPVAGCAALDVVRFSPDEPAQAAVLAQIRQAFAIPAQEDGYELRLREALSGVWLALAAQAAALPAGRPDPADGKIKQMLTYVHGHYAEQISIAALAASAYLSERECFRVFREKLHTSPGSYIRRYRVQMACRMLAETTQTAAAIGYACGLGSSSYFGRVFREETGCTPSAYRAKWQDRDIIGR